MPEITLKTEEVASTKIRRVFDVTTQKAYFSVVDLIGALTTSKDPQNYWKVLKNRLKKRSPELVTKCNQLKLKAQDGKYYLTDVADSETIIQIIEAIPKASVEALKVLISDVEKALDATKTLTPTNTEGNTLGAEAEAQLLVDVYETKGKFYIVAMCAGIEPESIHIYVYGKKVIISGNKDRDRGEKYVKTYLREELLWATFSREIELPTPVHPESLKRVAYRGMLTLELQKI